MEKAAQKGSQGILKFFKDNATLIALIILGTLLSFADEAFFTPRNFSNLARQVVIIGIIAVGMTKVIIINGIDLSVGSLVGLSAIIVTLLMQQGYSIWLAIIMTIMLSGVLVGLWNGFWIAHYKIPPFIITLGMMTFARGLALSLSGGSSVPVTNDFFAMIGGEYIPVGISLAILAASAGALVFFILKDIKEKKQYGIEVKRSDIISKLVIGILTLGLAAYVFSSYRGIPVPVALFVIIAGIGIFILNKTKYGRSVYALGGNEDAARLSGINIYMTQILVYVTVAVLASISGILLASRLNGASPNLGNMFELDAISAVVIGGTSFAGGIGTIGGTIIGAFIIGVLNNGMSLLGVPTFYQLMIKGGIIILAVWFDVLNKKKKI